MNAGDFAAIAVALYVGHHVGDYWVQRDVDARRKAEPGLIGRLHCAHHVSTYLMTQALFLVPIATMVHFTSVGIVAGLTVSGLTHYIADRRTPLVWLARRTGKTKLAELGAPRPAQEEEIWSPCPICEGSGYSGDQAVPGGKCWDCRGAGILPGRLVITDNPTLGTGMHALDQSWHIFWGVFVTALVMVIL